MPALANLFENLPIDLSEEAFETLLQSSGLKVERIVSKGHSSPEHAWYDQPQHEWVVLLQGEARIELEGEGEVVLIKGSYLNLPAHTRHRVTYTSSQPEAIWLAIHY